MSSAVLEQLQAVADQESPRHCEKCGRGLVSIGRSRAWDAGIGDFGPLVECYIACGCQIVQSIATKEAHDAVRKA